MPVFANVHLVSPSEANDLITEDDPLILDVRTPAEYAAGHLEGAVNLPLDSLNDDSAASVIGSKDRELLAYCQSGTRSSIACGMLVEMGYKNVYDMNGGIAAWTFGTVK